MTTLTTQNYVAWHVLPVASALLPQEMTSPAAWAMLLAIGRQESRFTSRRQVASYRPDGTRVEGPARGWWQFELGGVEGVLEHRITRVHAGLVLAPMGYSANPREVHLALEHNDVLAAVFARLLLWIDPRALPRVDQPADGWLMYLAQWRPGKPKPETWNAHFAAAWAAVGR